MAQPAPMPNIDTCNACGKLFPRTAIRLCSKCVLVEDNRFELVKEYLSRNDGAAVGEISGATGVSASDVRCFMEGGRLVSLEAVCTCGGAGERCRLCRSKLSNGFQELARTMERELGAGGSSTAEPREGGERVTYERRIRRVGER